MSKEKVHTIMIWVESVIADEVYNKICEAIKENESQIKFHAVAPFLIKMEKTHDITGEISKVKTE